MKRLITVEFGPSRSKRFGRGVAEARSRAGECSEVEPGRSPGIGFGPDGDGFVRFALVENEHRIGQAVRGIRRLLSGDG